MSLEILAKTQLQKWIDKGHETTCYTCPECGEEIEVRKPDPNMIPPGKKYWRGVKECYNCHSLTIVRTYPNGKTITEK